jgi:hypothetical protein
VDTQSPTGVTTPTPSRFILVVSALEKENSMTTTTETDQAPPTRFLRKVPVLVWVVTALGGVTGVLLAESGDFWGNTVPSALTFMVAGLVIGVAGWALVAALQRRGGRS